LKYTRIFLPVVIAFLAFPQDQQHADGTRQLYYLGPETAPPGTPPASPKAAALHLGLRYNVVLVHEGGNNEQIPANRVLNEGDCFAIDLQTNRAGYLYVLARQSSGSWMPLFPRSDMSGQRNQIEPFKKIEVPDGYCFSIHKPAGKETLFVVLSRDHQDFFELYESVKSKQDKGGGAGTTTQMADAKQLDATVQHLDEQFAGSRDLSIARVAEPVRKDEPRGAVYVVNKSDKPSSLLVTKIEVLHR
jgi:hypothetical protein